MILLQFLELKGVNRTKISKNETSFSIKHHKVLQLDEQIQKIIFMTVYLQVFDRFLLGNTSILLLEEIYFYV